MDPSAVLNKFDLTDRVAIVTGGSRGIGRAIALDYARLGAKVVVASRKADACEAVVEEIHSSGGKALAVPTHVGELDQIARLVNSTVDRFDAVDIVVNNAANPLALPIGSITAEALAKSYETNLRGPVFLVQEALPYLRTSEHASVINMVTAGIFTSAAFVSMYAAAKSALQSMTRSMAAELAADGIRVNAIAPGTIRTDMVLNTPEEFQQAAVNSQMIKRMGEPEEIASGAVFLGSDASSFMTGQTLVIDGGMTTH